MQDFPYAREPSDSGSAVKVHDYMGLSEVSSAVTQASSNAQCSDLTLDETDLSLGLELRLGPAKKNDVALLPDAEPSYQKMLTNSSFQSHNQAARNCSQICVSGQQYGFESGCAHGKPLIVQASPASRNGMKRGFDATQNLKAPLISSRMPVSINNGEVAPNRASSKAVNSVPWRTPLEKSATSVVPTKEPIRCCPADNHRDTASIGSPPAKSEVVGWPPVATSRKQHTCSKPSELFVKVNMDGITVGRKVDLIAHSSYDSLFLALEDMFQPSITCNSEKQSWLRNGTEFFLTYEDKDGDWMLVGDVPWSMFVNTVERLWIARRFEGSRPGKSRMH